MSAIRFRSQQSTRTSRDDVAGSHPGAVDLSAWGRAIQKQCEHGLLEWMMNICARMVWLGWVPYVGPSKYLERVPMIQACTNEREGPVFPDH
jgi:hypothetical protein